MVHGLNGYEYRFIVGRREKVQFHFSPCGEHVILKRVTLSGTPLDSVLLTVETMPEVFLSAQSAYQARLEKSVPEERCKEAVESLDDSFFYQQDETE